MKVFLQNRLLDEKEAHVSVLDHGYLYGDGIYETVRAYDYRVYHWPEHYRRLRQSARLIALKCPWSSSYLLAAIQKVLRANREPNASVRVTISRGPGPLGLDPTVCPTPTLALLLHPARPLERIWKKGISIGLVQIRRNHPQCLNPQIKSNNALNTILAKMEAQQMGVFEGVLTNLAGHLTEGTTSNLFFVKKGCLYTPALSCGLLEGITRASLLQVARKAGVPLREGRYTLSDLKRADEVFLSSTTLEVAPVVSIVTRLSNHRRRRWRVGSGRPGAVTQTLHGHLRRQIGHELRLAERLL